MGRMILAAFSGPDDTSIMITIACFITAYFGPYELWAEVVDTRWFGEMRLGLVFLTIIFTFEIGFSLISFTYEMIVGRITETFQRRYKLKSFLAHISYMIFNVAIYLTYTQLPASMVLFEYPKLTTMAFGG